MLLKVHNDNPGACGGEGEVAISDGSGLQNPEVQMQPLLSLVGWRWIYADCLKVYLVAMCDNDEIVAAVCKTLRYKWSLPAAPPPLALRPQLLRLLKPSRKIQIWRLPARDRWLNEGRRDLRATMAMAPPNDRPADKRVLLLVFGYTGCQLQLQHDR